MKLVDHVRWHVCEGHERLFRRLPPFSLSVSLSRVFSHQETENARPPRARGACVLADKTETLELYISILGLDKRYERYLYNLGLSELRSEELVGSREQFRLGGRSRKELDGERRKRWLCCLSPLLSIVLGPFRPKRGEGSDNEGDRSFWRFRFQKFRRSISRSHVVESVLACLLPIGRSRIFFIGEF